MELSGDSTQSEPGTSNAAWWASDLIENLNSVSLAPREETLTTGESASDVRQAVHSSQVASQTLWSTGTFSGLIPNGFYSIIPDKKLKELFDTIPSPDELFSLGMEMSMADIILVDAERDKKLSMLKQLSAAMVKGIYANPALVIKKIAGLVFDFYKRPSSELSPAKASVDDISHLMDNKGIQLLGQIRQGSCRPRAILFKVLADAVGLESKLVVGLPSDGGVQCIDSFKHMSVVVVLNSVELLVDLMRYPGQLIPFSTKAIFISHISAAGESDSAEYDSCDSPLEPNSPLYGLSDKVEAAGYDIYIDMISTFSWLFFLVMYLWCCHYKIAYIYPWATCQIYDVKCFCSLLKEEKLPCYFILRNYLGSTLTDSPLDSFFTSSHAII
ncbi:hypothetical protein BHE74_00047870 [Ensete ventricosum]|uniref:EDR1/CTR1/ARMC3-like peptidase-like domain-containing protein n=1 Tax=Ensete ventricosum TaxID=4639 RepID=A0A426Y6S3_ENSVE|nr:hypothetical protein B296_00053737 [Ensete ventricosum]RWW46215.1 hypothetical protein BHE74_00047870 [Ensete ventricosum]